MRSLILFLLLIFGASLSLSGKNDTLRLDGRWQLQAAGNRKWIPAEVPGTVHQALLVADKIPHPYLKRYEKRVQWIEKKNWIYQRTFSWTEGDDEDEVWLHLEGLDTYAIVILNGDTLLHADNMFRSWKIPVRQKLQAGTNQIRIVFTAPLNRHQALSPLEQYLTGTAGNDGHEHKVAVLTRKAQFQFGWDWGPRLVGSGIWRPVYLVREAGAALIDHHYQVVNITDSTATVRLETEYRLPSPGSYQFQLQDQNTGAILVSQPVTTGQEKLEVAFEIQNPKLWWVPPLGDPHLYHWEMTLFEEGEIVDRKLTSYGLRTIELEHAPDSIGTSYFFRLNGIPFFAKGANMIPPDALQPDASEDQLKQLLLDAHAVGMNMIRVWGGGVYPSDRFYQLCDSLGILVWQDLMFACGMYPASASFLENVEAEVREQQKRFRNHPCLALWCGNNEVAVGWHNWGWQQSLEIPLPDSLLMIQGYRRLFDTLFPSIFQSDPSVPYISTSPISNWGTAENFNHSSMHYWGVWHGGDRLEDYRQNVGRFMSEYGFQSFPAPSTIQTYAPKRRQQRLKSPIQKAHQKSYIGNEEILRQMTDFYLPPTDFADFVYKSQLTQRTGMQIAIRSHRGSRSHCMGSLYWQLNDCWPGPSWSSIDYYGNWKAFHYRLRELYHPILLIPQHKKDSLQIRIINDFQDPLPGTLRLELFSLKGDLIHMSHHHGIQLPGSGYYDWTLLLEDLIPADNNQLPPENERCLRIFWVAADGTQHAQTTHYWVPPKDLNLPAPEYQLEIDTSKNVLRITAKSFIKDLFLEAGPGVHFQENFFDLLPGEAKEIPFEGPLSDLKSIQVHSL